MDFAGRSDFQRKEFLPYLSKAKAFSKLDVENTFLQVQIFEKSKPINIFITKEGLLRYTGLMFGITCAPELFQKKIN